MQHIGACHQIKAHCQLHSTEKGVQPSNQMQYHEQWTGCLALVSSSYCRMEQALTWASWAEEHCNNQHPQAWAVWGQRTIHVCNPIVYVTGVWEMLCLFIECLRHKHGCLLRDTLQPVQCVCTFNSLVYPRSLLKEGSTVMLCTVCFFL